MIHRALFLTGLLAAVSACGTNPSTAAQEEEFGQAKFALSTSEGGNTYALLADFDIIQGGETVETLSADGTSASITVPLAVGEGYTLELEDGTIGVSVLPTSGEASCSYTGANASAFTGCIVQSYSPDPFFIAANVDTAVTIVVDYLFEQGDTVRVIYTEGSVTFVLDPEDEISTLCGDEECAPGYTCAQVDGAPEPSCYQICDGMTSCASGTCTLADVDGGVGTGPGAVSICI
jgi:hypothetical protein